MPRQFTKKGEKRFIRLGGGGAFTRPKLILSTTESKRKRVSIAGKVLKQYKGLLTAKEGVRLKRMTKTYTSILEKLDIPYLPARLVLTPTRNNKFQLNAVQNFKKREAIVSKYLTTCTKESAINVVRQVLEYARKVENHNKTSEQKIMIDAKPENMALIDGKVTLIDLYPPFLRGEQTTTAKDLRERLVSKKQRAWAWFFPEKIDAAINFELDRYFEEKNYLSKKVLKVYLRHAPWFEKEILAVAKKEFDISLK